MRSLPGSENEFCRTQSSNLADIGRLASVGISTFPCKRRKRGQIDGYKEDIARKVGGIDSFTKAQL